MKKRSDKVIWYVLALAVIVVLIMVVFSNEIGFSPLRNAKKIDIKKTSADLASIGTNSYSGELAALFSHDSKKLTLGSQHLSSDDSKAILELFSVKGGST